MRCPNCYHAIRPSKVDQFFVQGCLREFTCPKCQVWLANTPLYLILKIIGCYGGLICGVASYNFYQYQSYLLPLGLIGGVVMLVAHMMDQLHVISEPTLKDAVK